MSGARVELLWWRGCPSWEAAIELARERMEAAGFDPADLIVREITDREQAERESFPGSPTILVDGRDIQEPGEHPGGLTCRVYRLRDGRVSALPDPADVAAALAAAGERTDQAVSEAEHLRGRAAPPLQLPDTAGEVRALPAGPAEAAATVVFWTCNHCPYALAWQDRLVEVANDYAERGVRVLAVNSNDAERYPADGPEAMRERVERERWPFPFLFDESQEVARAWGAKTTPHLFVLDPEQRIVYEGAPDADHQDPSLRARWLREALDAVLDGSEPPPSTEPVGCSIKWR